MTGESEVPTSGSTVTKTYAYDAWGHRLTMSNKLGTASPSLYSYGADVHGSPSLLLGDASTNPVATYGYPMGQRMTSQLTLEIHSSGDLTSPTRVERNLGQLGGGECWATCPVDMSGLPFVELGQ